MIYFLLIHIALCIIVLVLYRTHRIKTKALMMPTVIMVPIVGGMLLAAEEILERKKINGNKKLAVENLKIADIKYKQIDMDADQNQTRTVPLEEAIIMNDSSVKRSILLDVLKNNPDDCITLLQKARNADDTELVHFATTAMMEMQSQFEKNLQEFQIQLEKDPEDIENIKKYCRELQRYIRSKLISGNILMIYQKQLEQVLEILVERMPENEEYWYEMMDNKMAIKKIEHMEDMLMEGLKRWQGHEKVYQLCVKYYHMTHQSEKIREIMQQVERQHIYLSRNGREWFQFWNQFED